MDSSGHGNENGKKLVIVESPAKARTINRYLGNDYIVKASMGHVRDLPKKGLKGKKRAVPGVDIEHDFEPTYTPLPRSKKNLAELKKFSQQASKIYLATDLDREGEAIAWHLAESLKLPPEKTFRVVFNEITRSTIREAFENPRHLDMHMVNAQQARRILDRIVGYQVSPLLWKKVAGGLSAGRVQSVAVRLIVEREEEIDAFEPEEYWRIRAVFCNDPAAAGTIAEGWKALTARKDENGRDLPKREIRSWLADHGAFEAELEKWNGEKFKAGGEETALAVATALGVDIEDITRTEDEKAKGKARNRVIVSGRITPDALRAVIAAIEKKETRTRPYAPFITATLQQAASIQLRFSASRTMRIAQQLYEGINIPGEGHIGLITYMRTDSRNLSRLAVSGARELIEQEYGDRYLPEKPNVYASGKRAQEAHEAIRPSDPRRKPEDISNALTNEQLKLYSLIWRQTVASQMTPAEWEVTDAEIVARTGEGEAVFKASGRRLVFDGFLRVAGMPRNGDQILPELKERQKVGTVSIAPTQHCTQPPPRYTEASLVKAMEANNIGRPSTYAPIIQTIQDRKYVELIKRSFHPTDMGRVVTKKLVESFPDLFETGFTAHMENQLDLIEEAESDRVSVLRNFYGPFEKQLEKAAENMVHAKAESEESDYTCPTCSAPMVYRFGKNGRFLSCSAYPDCKTAMPIDREGRPLETKHVDVACPECGAPMMLRRGRFGPFLSCSTYPDCKGTVKLDKKGQVKHPAPPPLEVDVACPKCGSATMNLRRGKRGPWIGCVNYPKCRGRAKWSALDGERKQELETALDKHEKDNPVPTLKKLDGEPVGDGHMPVEIEGENEVPAPGSKAE